MKKPEVKFGAEPKKLAVLGGLIVIAAIAYYISSSDTPKNTTATPGPAIPPPVNVGRIDPAVPIAGPNAPRAGTARGSKGPVRNFAQKSSIEQEFRPTLKPKDPIDPSRVDPTLHLPLLARVKGVGLEGGGRTLFDFSSAPAPKVEIAKVKPIIPGGAQMAKFIGPLKPEEPKPVAPTPPAPKPPPPPIPLKFYGFSAKQSNKRAFFLEGEDIFVAGEGDLIKNRYKVIRIGVNSAVVEDTSDKHQQTLPLEAEQANS